MLLFVDCAAGSHGIDCAEMCGQCLGGTPCDVYSGDCEFGCEPGWNGTDCVNGNVAKWFIMIVSFLCMFVYLILFCC